MKTSASPVESDPQQAEDPRQRRLRRQIEQGMDSIRRIDRDARTDPARLVELSLEYVRVADRVQRAIRTSHRLHQAAQARAAAAAAKHAARRTAARKRIIREVEDAIQCVTHGAEAEALHKALCERLDQPDLDGEIISRPVADIIADTLRDLGLAPSRAYAEGAPPLSRPAPPPRMIH